MEEAGHNPNNALKELQARVWSRAAGIKRYAAELEGMPVRHRHLSSRVASLRASLEEGRTMLQRLVRLRAARPPARQPGA